MLIMCTQTVRIFSSFYEVIFVMVVILFLRCPCLHHESYLLQTEKVTTEYFNLIADRAINSSNNFDITDVLSKATHISCYLINNPKIFDRFDTFFVIHQYYKYLIDTPYKMAFYVAALNRSIKFQLITLICSASAKQAYK